MIGPKTRAAFFVALALYLSLLPAGCNTAAPAADAPDIPPASTFVMNFDDFSDGADNAKVVDFDPSVAQLAIENWGFSAINVGVWNVIITVGLAVPVAAYLESFNHTPTLETDGTFVWTYSFDAGGATYSAELHGRIMGNDVEWDMFITKDGEFSNFNWYSGVSTLDRTEGSWTLNKDPLDPTPFIEIVWHRDPETGAADITYTNVEPDAPENGSYISYTIDPDQTLDSSYVIFGATDDVLTEIEWSRSTKAGRVRASSHFEDEEWHCWDDARQNADCTE